MRICFLSTGNFAHVGAYLEHFREAGHEVHFLALSPSPPRRVRTHELGLGGGYDGGRGKWKYPLSMLRARRLVRRLRPDIVHAHYATSGGLAGLICGFHPTIVTAHGTDLTAGMRSPLRRALLKAVFEGAECVNTVSADLTAMAVRLGVERAKIAELTPGVDTRRFARAERPPRPGAEGPLRIVCTRRLEPVYDHRTIIEALAILKTRGVECLASFAGDGSLRPELEDLVRRRGLSGSASFLGALDDDAMPAVLRAHDVYVSASRADGTSLSLLEAMAAGLYPVVSSIAGNRAWLEHGQGGFLHRVGDPEDLANGVMAVRRRPALAAAAAGVNRAAVVERGDRGTNMRRLEKIYERLRR